MVFNEAYIAGRVKRECLAARLNRGAFQKLNDV
jgi:hypothetical protein